MDHVIPIINARTGKFNEHGLWVKDPQPATEEAPVSEPESASATAGKMDTLNVQYGGNHYKDFDIEPDEFLVRNEIPFAEGNAIKYLSRHRFKGGEDDVKKAIHYSQMVLESSYGIKSTFQAMG